MIACPAFRLQKGCGAGRYWRAAGALVNPFGTFVDKLFVVPNLEAPVFAGHERVREDLRMQVIGTGNGVSQCDASIAFPKANLVCRHNASPFRSRLVCVV